MAFALKDRIQETTTTTGTGTITLAGAVTGFQSFAAVGNGSTTYYCITSGSAWEVGLGTYSTTGPTLARTTIYSNSLGTTAAISLTGTSNVFVTLPAQQIPGDGKFLQWQSVQTSNFTAVSGYAYPVNTTSGAITVTLPASPNIGDVVTVVDYAGTTGTNVITVSRNGSNIQGSASNVSISVARQALNFVYIDATQGWISYAQQYAAATLPPVPISYLIVAGGAGGGGKNVGGGGGAGGFLYSTSQFVTPNSTYTITVGAGGAGVNTAITGGAGNNSLISGVATAIGGGGGGHGVPPDNGGAALSGSAGGSGGGGGGVDSGTGGSGGAGTSGQGNTGGAGNTTAVGGGGGGAGGVGVQGSAGNGGAGGTGTANSISGTSITYAGGGSAGGNTGSNVNPAGGGGRGGFGNPASQATSGLANYGAGGGGNGGYETTKTSGAGGSGIVIISYPTTYRTATVTGGGAQTTVGGNYVYTFTSSGTIVF